MAWRQGQSYSEDRRARVLAAVDGGMAARAAARVFRVSVSYIYKALIRRRRTGEVSASSRRGQLSFADARASDEVAPIPAIRAIEIRPPNSIWPPGGLVRDERPCRGTA